MKLIQGDTLTFSVTLRNSDQTPINLTGATITFSLAGKVTASSPMAIVYSTPCTITNASGGIAQVLVSEEITETWIAKEYLWEIQIKIGTEIRTTPAQSLVIISQLTPNV